MSPDPVWLVPLYTGKFGHKDRHVQREENVKRRGGEAGHLQAQGSGREQILCPGGNQPCQHVDFGLLASRTLRQ